MQAAVALEALLSAAFLLIGSKLGDLFGRKRAYITGLVFYASGALAMVFAQDLAAIIVFWAFVGGLGAALYLPAMQSLIHANFQGKGQAKVFAMIGARASALLTRASGPGGRAGGGVDPRAPVVLDRRRHVNHPAQP